jgi:hypothetical protein
VSGPATFARMRTLVIRVVAFAAFAASMLGCSPDETDCKAAAEEAIEGDLADQLAIGELTAECDDPENTDVDTTFTCTAQTESGSTIDLDAVIVSDEEVQVDARNVLTADDVASLEGEAARVLAEQVGQDLPAENIECGTQSLVIVTSEPTVCVLTDPESGEVYDATVVFDDVESGAFTVEVAEEPRP